MHIKRLIRPNGSKRVMPCGRFLPGKFNNMRHSSNQAITVQQFYYRACVCKFIYFLITTFLFKYLAVINKEDASLEHHLAKAILSDFHLSCPSVVFEEKIDQYSLYMTNPSCS